MVLGCFWLVGRGLVVRGAESAVAIPNSSKALFNHLLERIYIRTQNQGSIQTVQGCSHLAQDHQQPVHVGPLADLVQLHAFQEEVADYFDDLAAFVEEVLSLDHPHLGPFLDRPLFIFFGPFNEGEFVHEDSVQAHSQTHHIAFLVIHVVLSDKPVGKLLHLLLLHDKIVNIWLNLFFFLLEPLIHPVAAVETSNFHL